MMSRKLWAKLYKRLGLKQEACPDQTFQLKDLIEHDQTPLRNKHSFNQFEFKHEAISAVRTLSLRSDCRAGRDEAGSDSKRRRSIDRGRLNHGTPRYGKVYGCAGTCGFATARSGRFRLSLRLRPKGRGASLC